MRYTILLFFVALVWGGYYDPDHFPMPSSNTSVPFVDCFGQSTNNHSLACGVTYDFCLQQTVDSPGWVLTTWNLFVPQFGAWLLPWLALTAQLPFETKDQPTNLMSLMLILGSPLLGAYSLTLMILNAHWINAAFRKLQQSNVIALHPKRPDHYDALDSVRWILIETMHVPIKCVFGRDYDLAQMIVRPENAEVWKSLAGEIAKTKRAKTFSLYAQLGWVVVAQVLSLIQFFTTGFTDNSVALGLAINSLWSWMLPLVWGWVFVGAQTSAESIRLAFQSIRPVVTKVARGRHKKPVNHDNAHNGPNAGQSSTEGHQSSTEDGQSSTEGGQISTEGGQTSTEGGQASIEGGQASAEGSQVPVDGGQISTEDRQAAIEGRQAYESRKVLKESCDFLEDRTDEIVETGMDTYWGLPIAGYEKEPGELFVFARVYTHMTACEHIRTAFDELRKKQQQEKTVQCDSCASCESGDSCESWNEQNFEANLEGTAAQIQHYIFQNRSENASDPQEMNPLAEDIEGKSDLEVHSGAPTDIGIHFVVAGLIGFLLQWGTTGAAIFIAYR